MQEQNILICTNQLIEVKEPEVDKVEFLPLRVFTIHWGWWDIYTIITK